MVNSTISNGVIVKGVEIGNAAFEEGSWCHPFKMQLYGTIRVEGGVPPKDFGDMMAENVADGMMDVALNSVDELS